MSEPTDLSARIAEMPSDTESVGAFQAKTELSRLLREVQMGKKFVITKRGRPVAELKPLPKSETFRGRGDMKGKIWMSDDFCDPIEEMADYMG
jgi:prevent-host-death family protein